MLLLLLLSCFSRVRLCATPQTAATRLPHPWDSPGKNTGVGCHFLLQNKKNNNNIIKNKSTTWKVKPNFLLIFDRSWSYYHSQLQRGQRTTVFIVKSHGPAQTQCIYSISEQIKTDIERSLCSRPTPEQMLTQGNDFTQ